MNYYNEIETYIKKNEVSKKVRVFEENYNTLENYWNIGRLLVEAQGGDKRAKYGNGLIKEWSIQYTEIYGKGYDATNLRKFRQFYLAFSKCETLSRISWSHVVLLLPIKDENKRNYYINLCIKNNLSVRELSNEIKNNAYERLIDKPEKIELMSTPKKPTILENMKDPILLELEENENITNEHELETIILAKLKIIVPQKSSFLEQMKNPILIELEKGKTIQNERDLETTILAKLQNFFNQLGEGFTLVDNQYKISYEHKNYYIDILLFNYKFNCFFVVELKLRELRKEDKAQIEFYMKLIDEQIKEPFHSKTIGIIISKEQDKLIANFVKKESVIPLSYEIKKTFE